MHRQLVQHFLVENYIKTVLFLSCASPQDTHRLRKEAQKLHVWTASADISKDIGLDVERLFYYKNHRVAVVADLDCPRMGSVLGEVSKRTYFHQRYFWLIFANHVNQSVAMLGEENINVDAEITVAVPVSSDGADANGMSWRGFNQ